MGGSQDASPFSLSKIIGTVAPGIATVLGGPFAGIALSLLAHALGIGSVDAGKILDKINSAPDDSLAKIKALELSHSEAMARLLSENYANETKDKADARRYGVEYKEFLKRLAYIVTAGFFGVLILMFTPFGQISEVEQNLMSMLIGMLASKWQTIVDFFYGSSHPKG